MLWFLLFHHPISDLLHEIALTTAVWMSWVAPAKPKEAIKSTNYTFLLALF
jgi:hypothetical protein